MKRVLLIEDDAWLAELYGEALSSVATVIHAASAETALESIDQHKPDLLVLDIFLPEHSGVELLHELASYDDTGNLPIVMLSAVSIEDFALPKARWHHYGIVEYLYKPASKPRDITQCVQYHLNTFALTE